MGYFRSQWVINEVLSKIPGYDSTYKVEWYNSWSSYEEHGWKAILSKNGQFYLIVGGNSVMAEGPQDDIWDLIPVMEDEAIDIMEEFDETCNDFRDWVLN